jgi:hypothetical protein
MEEKFIFLRDPWRYVEDDDSGWGNRLICWEAAYNIGKQLDSNHVIKVLPQEFPELHLVNLISTSFTELQKITAIPIQDGQVDSWIQNNIVDLDPNLSYVTNFSFLNSARINRSFGINKKHIQKISIKNEQVQKYIKNTVKEFIGIHIRRGNGVYTTKQDLEEIPVEFQKYYNLCLDCGKEYVFIKDSIYFNIIDSILKDNPEALFYISIDVNEKAVDYFKTRYPDKIFTRTDIIEKNKNIFIESSFLDRYEQLTNMGYNLVDFFSLSFCKDIIESPFSSWCNMAVKISGKNSSLISRNLLKDTIVKYNELDSRLI